MQLKKLLYYALMVAVVVIAIGCGGEKEETAQPPAPAGSAPAPAGGGNVYDASKATASISGKASYEGPEATPAKLPMTPECTQAHGGPAKDEIITTNDANMLKDVFVYVKSGAENLTFNAPTEPVLLDQVGCHYKPHVVGIMVNQPLEILNSDPFLHNVHPMPTAPGNEAFNQGMPVKGMKITKTFGSVEMIPVKCDVHRWMSSFINVVKNPFYAVSGEDGSYSIKSLPAGTYTLEAWHEKLGTQTQEVTLTDGQAAEANFTFKAS